jgi:hypothetical protein
MYVHEGDKMLVSEFMYKKEKKFNPLETLILDKTFKYDLENFMKRYYLDFSQEQVREAAKAFCGKYAGYKKKYGITFTEKALIQIFF